MVAPLAMLGLSVAGDIASGIATDLVKSAGTAGQKDKIRKTAQDFETMFLEQTLDRLAENAGDAGPLGGGADGGSVYRSMLVKEYAGEIVRSGGVGIADSVYRQMLKLQEG